MDIRFEHIEEMPPSDRGEFLRAIAEDDVLRGDYATWLAVTELVRKRQDDALPDRSVLVLAALRRAGMESALTGSERRRLDEEWPSVTQAFSETPFLDDVLTRIAAEVTDFDQSWALREGHLQPRRPAERIRPRQTVVRALWRASAVAAVVVFAGILLFVLRRDASWVRVDVPASEIRTIALVDGSTVRVIGPADLEYRLPAVESSRPELLRLDGDAFFDVVPADEPFVIETPAARVSVLGTSFGVRSRRERTDVVVATGRVSVSARGADNVSTLLRAGQSCFVLSDEAPSAALTVDLSDALQWANLFVFRATPVGEIAATLARHYGVDVEVDPALSETTITGTFASDEDLRGILEVIVRAASASIVEIPTGFRLVPERLL